MTFTEDVLTRAHRHSSRHRAELETSEVCGCFYCLRTFQPTAIEYWIDEGSGTAHCPHCDIDSVLGAASGLPVTDPEFLAAMHERWFERISYAQNN